MNCLSKALVVGCLISLVDPVYGITVKYPSVGALIVNADVIAAGRFSVKGDDVFLRIEERIAGGNKLSCTERVVSDGRIPFFDFRSYAQSLNGSKCIVVGRKEPSGIVISYGAYSIWPFGVSACDGLKDFSLCREVVGLLLQYKKNHKNRNVDFVRMLMKDVDRQSGRIAVTSYLSEDVDAWRENHSMRNDVGCIVGWHLSDMNDFDNAGRTFFYSGMPSLPIAIALKYLYADYLQNGDFQSKKRLFLYLRTHGFKSLEDLTAGKVKSFAKEWLMSDMTRCMKLLDSEDDFIRSCASPILSAISSIPQPRVANRGEEKEFWDNEIKIMKNDAVEKRKFP